MALRYSGTRGTQHRSAFRLLTATNGKTNKGEKLGYLTAILYLAPHTSGGGTTLCPHSTDACRAMCLAGAGMSGLPLQLMAKWKRTQLFHSDRALFLDTLRADVEKLKRLAAADGLKPALRLNGTSDVLWEREAWIWTGLGVKRYDYTKTPLEHRRVDQGYHLTYSVGGPEDYPRALRYLAAGHSVAIVTTPEAKRAALERQSAWPMVDGDEHDLRFLDPPGSVVLLKPKGHKITSLVRPNFMAELELARTSLSAHENV